MRRVEIPNEVLPEGVARKPFSDAVLAGDTLYVSGRIGLDPQTGKPPRELEDEARALMENLCGVLAAAGYSLRETRASNRLRTRRFELWRVQRGLSGLFRWAFAGSGLRRLGALALRRALRADGDRGSDGRRSAG